MPTFDYDYAGSTKRSSRSRTLAIVWSLVTVAIVLGVIVFFVAGVADAWNIMLRSLLNDVWYGWFVPPAGLLHATPLFWWVVAVVGLCILWWHKPDAGWLKVVTTLVLIVLVLVSVRGIFLWGETGARNFNGNTEYVVEDLDSLPDTLTRVAQSAGSQIGITEGTMPSEWESRVASATGASYVMQKTGDSNANTELMSETITYIYGDNGAGAWTAIRDGKNRQSIFGVANWSGAGNPVTTCEFKGDYELNKAFGGSWGKNLGDDIAAFDKHFTYSPEDMYGYCDGDQPVIVIPGTRTGTTDVRTINVSYGVMTVTGSSTGRAVINFQSDVKPGELPGPVYPIRLVSQQREALSWSAGRVWPWQAPVGFISTDTTSQAGNSTDFLLKSKKNGRLYWVTPMKPLNTESQTLVAYSVTPADEMTAGELNQQRVYVLNGDDSRVVNLNDLENVVTQAVAKVDPGFFTGSDENVGGIVEFIPTSDDSWQVFAERGGRAVYRIDISGGARMNTTVMELNDEGEAEEPNPSEDETPGGDTETACGNATSSLTDAELATCLNLLTEELLARQDS